MIRDPAGFPYYGDYLSRVMTNRTLGRRGRTLRDPHSLKSAAISRHLLHSAIKATTSLRAEIHELFLPFIFTISSHCINCISAACNFPRDHSSICDTILSQSWVYSKPASTLLSATTADAPTSSPEKIPLGP